jgi:hemoglobin-like flavoprotein
LIHINTLHLFFSDQKEEPRRATARRAGHRIRSSTMTPDQVDLVQKSFDALWPVHRAFAERFYARFFELAPDARALFTGSPEQQQLRLMDMIAAIVGALDQRDLFHALIRHTGRQHAQFGALDRHYDAFGDALIWSLEQQFGKAFTPALRDAWRVLYDAVLSEMTEAAAQHQS